MELLPQDDFGRIGAVRARYPAVELSLIYHVSISDVRRLLTGRIVHTDIARSQHIMVT